MKGSGFLRGLATAVTFAAVGAPLGASATVTYPSASVTWTAPAACPSEATATAWIEGFLGQPLSESRVQRVDVEARVTETTAGFAAQLLVTTERGRFERQLDHQDCAKLAEAATFVIALAIDPERVQGKEPPAAVPPGSLAAIPTASAAFAPLPTAAPPCPPSATVPEPCRCPPPPAPPSATPPPATPERPAPWSAGVHGLVGAGALPEVGPGIGLEASWAPGPRTRLSGHVRWWTPRDRPVPGYAGAEVRLALTSVGLAACALPLAARLELRTCAALQLGSMAGVGVHVRDGAPRAARWSAVLGQATVMYWAGPHWGPFLGVEGGPALDRPAFGVSSADGAPLEVYRAGPWVANALIGLGFGTRADRFK